MTEIFRGNWIALCRTPDGYEYTKSWRIGTGCVAVLGYTKDRVLGRFEICPPHEDPEPALCALTGGVDPKESPRQAAVRELMEESGFKVDIADMTPIGSVRPSKSSDTVVNLFAVKLDPTPEQLKEKCIGEGDGSVFEQGSYCRFVDPKEAILSKDPTLATMTARYAGLLK